MSYRALSVNAQRTINKVGSSTPCNPLILNVLCNRAVVGRHLTGQRIGQRCALQQSEAPVHLPRPPWPRNLSDGFPLALKNAQLKGAFRVGDGAEVPPFVPAVRLCLLTKK